jgi:hypothetical protein
MVQAGMILGLAIVFYFIGNGILERGIVGVSPSAVFVPNYDDPEKYVRWDVFKSKYASLDPSGIQTSGPLVSITPPSEKERLLYGSKVASLQLAVSSKANSPDYRILLPYVLILVLDVQDNIRGKLLSPIQMSENTTEITSSQFWSMKLSSSQFWFIFPWDMRGTKYSVIVELFGSWIFACCGTAYTANGLYLTKDAYYGMLPQSTMAGCSKAHPRCWHSRGSPSMLPLQNLLCNRHLAKHRWPRRC